MKNANEGTNEFEEAPSVLIVIASSAYFYRHCEPPSPSPIKNILPGGGLSRRVGGMAISLSGNESIGVSEFGVTYRIDNNFILHLPTGRNEGHEPVGKM